jgi:hypothetical protein
MPEPEDQAAHEARLAALERAYLQVTRKRLINSRSEDAADYVESCFL